MKTFKLNAILFLVSIVFISCNSKDDEIIINDFKGLYKIKSIQSSLKIDLNNDGIQSNDYLQEIKSSYKSYNGEIIDYGYDNEKVSSFAEARPTKSQTQNNTQFLDLRFPIQRIDSIYLGNDKFVISNMEYGKMYTGFIYKLSNNNVSIESDSFKHFDFYKIEDFKIDRLNKKEFEISFNFKVYDFTVDKWVKTNVHTVYEKIEE